MTLTHKFLACCLMLSMLSFGCSNNPQIIHSDQESLGTGIVVGSIAEQQKHQVTFTSWPSSLIMKGQVRKIEGAAYVVTNIEGNEFRIPVDQETTIDRPAHVGDWIEAYIDDKGRAVQIRNIDEEIGIAED